MPATYLDGTNIERCATCLLTLPCAHVQKGSLMPKKAGRKRWTAERQKVSHRTNTHKPNGAPPESQEVAPEKIPIGKAMRRAVASLGEVLIDSTLAANQLSELADCYEQIIREQAAYDAKSEEAKTAKKALEGATEHLLLRVKEFTHPKALPLFDQRAAEADLQTMASGPIPHEVSESAGEELRPGTVGEF